MFKKYKNLLQFKKFYEKYKKLIISLLGIMIVCSASFLIVPLFVSQRLVALTELNVQNVITFSLVILGVLLFHHITWFFWSKWFAKLSCKVGKDIRLNVMNKILNSKFTILKNKTSGYYMERLNDDTNQISACLGSVMGTMVDCMTNVGFLVLIYVLCPAVGLLLTLCIFVLYFVDIVKIKKDLRYVEQVKNITEKMNSLTAENIKAIKDIKGLGIHTKTLNKYNDYSEKLASTQLKKETSLAFYSRIRTYLQYSIEAILFIVSICWLIPAGELSVVALLTIINYSGFMYEVVGFVTAMKDYFVKADLSAGRVIEILDDMNMEKFGNKVLTDNTIGIQIKNLSFAFEDSDLPVLKDINLNIEKNTSIAILGASGGGKSTLFNLLARLYQAPKDTIYFNGKEINSISEKTFRQKVCLINQEAFLFNDTVMSNLKICKNTSNKEIFEATKKANIHDEILGFEKGYATLITENGSNLSGGQKQRLAIARALIKNSSIMLFDEPTSALDNHNQGNFYNILDKLKGQKTIIVITHKLSDLSQFDKVYELSHGKLTEKK